jgi:hypothetical protein
MESLSSIRMRAKISNMRICANKERIIYNKDRNIEIAKRIVLGETYAAVSLDMGISRERVSQIFHAIGRRIAGMYRMSALELDYSTYSQRDMREHKDEAIRDIELLRSRNGIYMYTKRLKNTVDKIAKEDKA